MSNSLRLPFPSFSCWINLPSLDAREGALSCLNLMYHALVKPVGGLPLSGWKRERGHMGGKEGGEAGVGIKKSMEKNAI